MKKIPTYFALKFGPQTERNRIVNFKKKISPPSGHQFVFLRVRRGNNTGTFLPTETVATGKKQRTHLSHDNSSFATRFGISNRNLILSNKFLRTMRKYIDQLQIVTFSACSNLKRMNIAFIKIMYDHTSTRLDYLMKYI